jgi:hypothetical protein
VICANRAPDHTTIARFRRRHETALAGLFGEVLALCAEAGLVNVGVIAIDGTKVHADASQHANRDYERLAREVLEEADAVDAAEERFGDARGDELPPELATSQGGGGGCARPSAASTSGAPPRPSRSRAPGPSG